MTAALVCGAGARRRCAARELPRFADRLSARRGQPQRGPHPYELLDRGQRKTDRSREALLQCQGASAGKGAIIQGHVSPATFATIAADSHMTRTIRMAFAGNAVTRVESRRRSTRSRIGSPSAPATNAASSIRSARSSFPPRPRGRCVARRVQPKIPIFDGYTRFDIDLSYVGERKVSAKGYKGPVAVCSARYVPFPAIAATGRRPGSWPRTRTWRSGWPRSPATTC